MKVGIINVTGYTGVELARLLFQHPEVKLTSVTGRSAAGQKLGAVFPHLAGLDLTIEAELGDVELVFSAMPHKESAQEVIPLLEQGIKVVDISADFRLKDASEYQRWYGFSHPAPKLLAQAVYGLPELYRKEIKKARLVALGNEEYLVFNQRLLCLDIGISYQLQNLISLFFIFERYWHSHLAHNMTEARYPTILSGTNFPSRLYLLRVTPPQLLIAIQLVVFRVL